MAQLKYYRTERAIFAEKWNYQIDNRQAQLIINKLTRHFKFQCPNVKFYGKRQCGRAYITGIKLPNNPTLWLLIHELAHIHNLQKYGNWHHNKKLLKTQIKLFKYLDKVFEFNKEPKKPEGSDK